MFLVLRIGLLYLEWTSGTVRFLVRLVGTAGLLECCPWFGRMEN